MREDTNRFKMGIGAIHKESTEENKESQGLSSTLSHCNYDRITSMIGKRIQDIPEKLISQANSEEYVMSRTWAKKGIGGMILTTLLSPLIAKEFNERKLIPGYHP